MFDAFTKFAQESYLVDYCTVVLWILLLLLKLVVFLCILRAGHC